jgi:hypothetical protein
LQRLISNLPNESNHQTNSPTTAPSRHYPGDDPVAAEEAQSHSRGVDSGRGWRTSPTKDERLGQSEDRGGGQGAVGKTPGQEGSPRCGQAPTETQRGLAQAAGPTRQSKMGESESGGEKDPLVAGKHGFFMPNVAADVTWRRNCEFAEVRLLTSAATRPMKNPG